MKLCIVEFEAESEWDWDGSVGKESGRFEQVDLSSSNNSQVGVVSELGAEGELSVVVDLSSEDGVSVDVVDGSDLESELLWLVWSV